MRQDQQQMHALVFRYGLSFFVVLLALLTLCGLTGFWLLRSDALAGWSKDQFEVLRDVATFFIGVLTLGITLAAAVVTLYIARSAMGIAQASMDIAHNTAQLAEREFQLEAQRHANEIFADVRAVQRQADAALQHHTSTSAQLWQVPEHWAALLLWRLQALARGDIWGGPDMLSAAEYRQSLLNQVRSLQTIPAYADDDALAHHKALLARIAHFESCLSQHPGDTPLQLLHAVDYLGDRAVWEQQRQHIAQCLRLWLSVLQTAESKPWVFHLYRHTAKTSNAWDWMHQHTERLLALFDSEQAFHQSEALEVVMRAMVLYRTGYMQTLSSTDLHTRLHLLPMLCLLAQTPGLVPAYQSGPDARRATQALYHTLKPLTHTQQQVREMAQLIAPQAQPLPNPDSMFAPAPESIPEAMHSLHAMWQEMASAHQQAPHIFAPTPTEDTRAWTSVEQALACWQQLAEATLQRRSIRAADAPADPDRSA